MFHIGTRFTSMRLPSHKSLSLLNSAGIGLPYGLILLFISKTILPAISIFTWPNNPLGSLKGVGYQIFFLFLIHLEASFESTIIFSLVKIFPTICNHAQIRALDQSYGLLNFQALLPNPSHAHVAPMGHPWPCGIHGGPTWCICGC
jgi:hypothetical protein